jgi:uncharacterized membrane protein SirB2
MGWPQTCPWPQRQYDSVTLREPANPGRWPATSTRPNPATNYTDIGLLHIGCAGISISLLLLSSVLQFSGIEWRQWRWLRSVPHANDTVLPGAAIALSLVSHQYPLAQGWLTAKLLALLLYIGLGSIAFRASRPRSQQAAAFVAALLRCCVAALLTVAYIVTVAIQRSPAAGLG